MGPRRGYLWLLWAALANAVALSEFAWGATPIIEYRFNGSGTSAASTGSDTTPVSFFDSTGSAANLYGLAGSGVSGLANDLAFDNPASMGMGSGPSNNNAGGRAE